mgnify:CR=1 FL=1
MKKIIYLFCLICTITLAKGQYYRPDRGFLPGINAGYFYPTGDMGKILKNGIGGNVSAKYLINKMIGIGFEAGYYGFKTKVNLNKDDVSQKYKYHLIPVLLDPIVCISEVSVLKNPSLSASRIATSDTSGISSPSRKRLIPTRTSNSPKRKSRIISIRSIVSISRCIYLTLTSKPSR